MAWVRARSQLAEVAAWATIQSYEDHLQLASYTNDLESPSECDEDELPVAAGPKKGGAQDPLTPEQEQLLHDARTRGTPLRTY